MASYFRHCYCMHVLYIYALLNKIWSVCMILLECMFSGLSDWQWTFGWCAFSWGRPIFTLDLSKLIVTVMPSSWLKASGLICFGVLWWWVRLKASQPGPCFRPVHIMLCMSSRQCTSLCIFKFQKRKFCCINLYKICICLWTHIRGIQMDRKAFIERMEPGRCGDSCL